MNKSAPIEGELIPAEAKGSKLATQVIRKTPHFVESAGALEVKDADDFALAADISRDIATMRSRLEDERKGIKAPILEAGRKVDAFFKALDEGLQKAVTVIDGKLTKYRNDERARIQADERRAAEEARKEREAAEAEAKRLRDAAQAAQEAGDSTKASELAEAAEATEVAAETASFAPTAIQADMPKAKGVAFVATHAFEVTDFAALVLAAGSNETLRSLLEFNESAGRNLAKMTKGAVTYPGLKYVTNESIRKQKS